MGLVKKFYEENLILLLRILIFLNFFDMLGCSCAQAKIKQKLLLKLLNLLVFKFKLNKHY